MNGPFDHAEGQAAALLVLPAVVHDEVDSTNSLARRMVSEHPCHGVVLRASSQTAGRGRFGRSWQAGYDTALLTSMVLRQDLVPLDGRTLTTLAAVACIDALHDLGDGCESSACPLLTIHWPNDVMAGGKKLAGVLVEQADGCDGRYWIVGLGLNVTEAPPLETARCCRDALGIDLSVNDVARAVYRRFDALLVQCMNDGPDELSRSFQDYCSLTGRVVVATQDGTVHRGRVVALHADGTMVLDTGVTLLPERTTGCHVV